MREAILPPVQIENSPTFFVVLYQEGIRRLRVVVADVMKLDKITIGSQ